MADYPRREQTIVHFQSVTKIDETKFTDSLDPIIVYNTKDTQEQVYVIPFNVDNVDKENLSFEEKMVYFDKATRENRYLKLIDVVDVTNTVVTDTAPDMGTYDDFLAAFGTPLNLDLSIQNCFGGIFLELDPSELDEVRYGLDNYSETLTDIKQHIREV